MKESNFYSDDFEQLIRDKTEQYKMYPSERVWKGVHNSLHTKRRWFIGSMSLLVTGILFFAGRELITPSARLAVVRKPATTAASIAEAPKPWLAAHLPHTSLSANNSSSPSSSGVRHNNAVGVDAGEGQDPEYKEISITLSHPVIDPSDLSGWLDRVQLPDHAPEIAVIAARTVVGDGGRPVEEGGRTVVRPGPENASLRESADASHETGDLADADGLSARQVLESLSAKGPDGTRHLQRAGNRSAGDEVSGLLPDRASNGNAASANAIAESQDRQRINWLHDYAMNTLPMPSRRGRTFFQLTLSPTINYRTLNGVDPSYEKYGNFTGNPSQLLNHSAAFGFEFGGSILYRLTRNLSIKGGLQFNFARYKITVFADSGSAQNFVFESIIGHEQQLAAQSANTAGTQRGNAPSPPTPVYELTLNNDYYQLSAPIGFELRVLGNERLQFNLGATVQPSYLLGTTSYMLSDDLTTVSKYPAKYRKWNVSGGLEAFLSYRTGNIRWQIGPELRYQFLSTYNSHSVLSENLKSYGLKIGLTKALP